MKNKIQLKKRYTFDKSFHFTKIVTSLGFKFEIGFGRGIPSKNGPCISPMFLIRKASGKARPIIDHMVKYSDTPKMVLPSVFQLVRKKIWEQGMWYLKLDFKSAFYNIPVHIKSQHLFNFCHQGKFYKFTRLPFGALYSYVKLVFTQFDSFWLSYSRKLNWFEIDLDFRF